MVRLAVRFGALITAVIFLGAPASAQQINWNVTFDNGSGNFWNDPTVIGTTTVGQARRDSIMAATTYLNTVLDGRGTVNITVTGSGGGSGNPLAFFGPNLAVEPNCFQNGFVYGAARANQHGAGAGTTDGQGTFFFGYNWNYVNQTPSGTAFDMVTVAIHELTHGLGFSSLLNSDGTGLGGQPNMYGEFDRFFQRGNGATGQLFNTNIAQSNYATFLGPLSTLTNGNNPTTGLFFGGKYAREVFGGPVPIYAPSPFEDGSSLSHVVDSNAVMNPSVAPNVVKRFQRYEIAMLMDIGWNVYNWNNTTGDWNEGISNFLNSRWRTDQGMIWDESPSAVYNSFANPGPAPILPPSGQFTSNIVLNFGTGTSQYTATNSLGTIRLARLNLNNSNTNHIDTITGGTLQFGVNNDGNNTSSVLTPKIVQQNSGAFVINSNIIVTNTTGAPGGGWSGLTVDGTGSGKVTLGGVISGNGTLAKAGTFTLELNGASANTYTGLTTISGGTLIANKTPAQNAITGDITLATGGTLVLGNNNQLQDASGTGHKVSFSGGTLSTGATTGFSDAVGAFELTGGLTSTIDLGTGVHELRFLGITGTPNGTLSVLDWPGTGGNFGTQGKLIFVGMGSTPNADFSSFLSTVQFQNFGTGATFLGIVGQDGVYELVPVPEPATVLALAFGTLAAGAFVRRRRFAAARLEADRGGAGSLSA